MLTMCKWMSFLPVKLILYIKDTISVLGWKLRPLPAYTVPRHIHWQGINLKLGMLLRPKCWQLIQIWCEHTHIDTHTLTHHHHHHHCCHPDSRMGMLYNMDSQCVLHRERGTRHFCPATCIWMDIWRRKQGKVWCENMTTNTIWIMILHVKAWSNICICTRNTQIQTQITREQNAWSLILKTTLKMSHFSEENVNI